MTTATSARGPPPSPDDDRETTTDHTDHHPRGLQRMSTTPTHARTEAQVVAYYPPTPNQRAARVEVACPFGCRELTPTGRPKKGGAAATHLHGIGPAGAVPDLGSRVAHCPSTLGQTYFLVDPRNLVPERIELAQEAMA